MKIEGFLHISPLSCRQIHLLTWSTLIGSFSHNFKMEKRKTRQDDQMERERTIKKMISESPFDPLPPCLVCKKEMLQTFPCSICGEESFCGENCLKIHNRTNLACLKIQEITRVNLQLTRVNLQQSQMNLQQHQMILDFTQHATKNFQHQTQVLKKISPLHGDILWKKRDVSDPILWECPLFQQTLRCCSKFLTTKETAAAFVKQDRKSPNKNFTLQIQDSEIFSAIEHLSHVPELRITDSETFYTAMESGTPIYIPSFVIDIFYRLTDEREMILFMFWVVVSLLHELSHAKMFTYGKEGDPKKKTPPKMKPSRFIVEKDNGGIGESGYWLEEQIFGTTISLDTDALEKMTKVCLYFGRDRKDQIFAPSCSIFFNDTIWNAKERSIQDFHVKRVPSQREEKRFKDLDLEKTLEMEAHVPKLTTDDPRHWSDDQTVIEKGTGRVIRVRY